MPLAHATSIVSTVPRSIAAMKSGFLSTAAARSSILSRQQLIHDTQTLELLDRLHHQAGCLCRVLSQAPVRAVSLMMRSISARVSSFANSPAIAAARTR
jgi:hypothetical protein